MFLKKWFMPTKINDVKTSGIKIVDSIKLEGNNRKKSSFANN
jgi:hypothetical protein